MNIITPEATGGRIRVNSSMMPAKPSENAMSIMNDYNADPYKHTNQLPVPKNVNSTKVNPSINRTMMNGYGSLANSGYQNNSLSRDKNVTKSQKDLINRSYDFKGDIKLTR